ncbi:MAG: threonine/serine dehydratase [Alphaproteobacteria bacterium]|nr:threonine/serine dehydratase [Alphaproteobacteria bacterium]
MQAPTLDDVHAAASRLRGFAIETPLLENGVLNERAGLRVLIKAETLQHTGSFKFRGALNRVLLIPDEERARGVVAFSSGNHAQGVAAAARLLGVPATIVMPSDAPRVKIEGTRSLGAKIVFYDRGSDDREEIARGLVDKAGATLVRPFDDALVVAGQATIGLEIVAASRAKGCQLDWLVAPAGGGGLVSGIALALSELSPETRIVSAEPENFDGMRRSLEAGRRVAASGGRASAADALMAPMPGEIPFAIACKRLSFGVALSDNDLLGAVAFAARHLKLIVEPGGAAALAAILSARIPSLFGTVAIVLTGANCDPETIAAACALSESPARA